MEHTSGQTSRKPKAQQPKAEKIANQVHISSAAAEQFIARGVPQHVLAQVHAALRVMPVSAHSQNGRQKHGGYVRKSKRNKPPTATAQAEPEGTCCLTQPQAESDFGSQPSNRHQSAAAQAHAQAEFQSSHAAAAASAAVAMKARMDTLLQRVSDLEEPAVQSGGLPDLHWQPLTIKLPVCVLKAELY